MRTHLHLFPTFALGGAQRRFAQLARGVPGWRHVIVALDGDRSADAALGDAPRRYADLKLDKSGALSLRNLRRLARLYKEVRPDLVSTYNWGAVEGLLANRLLARRPHLHHEDGFGQDEAAGEILRRRTMRRLALSGHAHLVVPSAGLAARAAETWCVPPARLHHLPNGVDTARFTPGRDGAGPVVFLGALRPEKNLPRLIRAASAAGVPLDLWGEGSEQGALAPSAPLGVRFRGGTDAPEAALSGARLLALSSDTEQMPLVVLEAMACGLPVVATDVGDTKAMVAEENAPFVTPLGDDAAFTAALRTVATDEALAARLGAANRARAEAVFGLETMIGAHGRLWDEVAR